MALIVEFICELPNGVHARPASHVETLCNTCLLYTSPSPRDCS